jgi:hypothetical protein
VEPPAKAAGAIVASPAPEPKKTTARTPALTRDDRIDVVAGAVAHFQRAMMMDVDQAAKAMRDDEMLAEIEDFIEGFNQPTYPRYAGQWGPGAHLEHPARLEWAVGAALPGRRLAVVVHLLRVLLLRWGYV